MCAREKGKSGSELCSEPVSSSVVESRSSGHVDGAGEVDSSCMIELSMVCGGQAIQALQMGDAMSRRPGHILLWA